MHAASRSHSNQPPALSTRALRVNLGAQEIVRSVDLDAESGQILGVLGPSGSGKTTLFRALAGELPASEGDIFLDGREVTRQSLWQRARLGMSYVPQTPSVLLELTVAQNIDTFAQLVGCTQAASTPLIEALELGPLLATRAKSLSGGERRRLELLRGLLPDRRVLILDEPFAGLDQRRVEKVGQLLVERAARGRVTILADHRVSDVLGFCHRAALLVDGRVLCSSAAEDFQGLPAVQRHYLA